MKYIAAIVGGLLAGGLLTIIIGQLLLDIPPSSGFLLLLSSCGLLSYLFSRALNTRNAIGRVCLALALEFFALPIATIVFSIRMGKNVPPEGAEVFGAFVAGGFFTIIAIIVGFFGGMIFSITAYFLLRKKKVT